MVRSYKPDDSLEFNVFSIPESHHAEFRAGVGDAARVAISDFPSNLGRLTRILERLDCPTVLANFAFFGLWTSVDNEGRLNEAIPHIFPHHAELLQAIALTIEPNDWGGVPLVNEMEEIFDVVDVVSRVPLMKQITDNLDKRQEHPAVQEMRFRMRVNTQIVRNWDYYHDTLNTARKLYGPLNEGLKHQLGFDVDDLLSLADKIKSLVEARAERHAKMLGQAICAPTEKEKLRRYYDWNSDFKDTPDDVHAALKSRSVDVGAFIFQHSSLFLSEMYTFDVTTLSMDSGMPAAIVEEILRALSLEPGALVGSNPQHLFLANPVWLQPAIDIGNGKFMVPLIQAIFSHLYLIVKRLAEQGGMVQQLDMRRSEYLEREVVDVLKSVPMARVMPNKKWSWQDGVFETDCLACLDRTLLIVEVKSSRLTQESMKATPRAFKNLIEKLVLNPSLQSTRLMTILESAKAKKEDKDALAVCHHLHIDPLEVDLVIRLSITLDDISIVYTAEEMLKEANWIPLDHDLPVTMTIHDFKHIVDILDNPIFLFHYLYERYFIQKRWRIMSADELDLLGVYLRSGMNMAGLPDGESDILVLAGESDAIDRHYNARDAGIRRRLPKPHLHPLFRRVVDKLSTSKPPRWITIGRHILSCADYREQGVVERKLNRLRKIVRRTWQQDGHKCSLVVMPPEARKAPIVFYLFPEELRRVSRQRAVQLGREVLEQSGRSECCVLVRSIENWRNPYEAILLAGSRS